MPCVSSCNARACSRGGRLPHCSTSFFNFADSTVPGPPALAMPLSVAGGEGFFPDGGPDELPGAPPGQAPPLGQLPPPLFLFSSSLIISSRRDTISFWIFWVFGPPRDRSRRRSTFRIF